jgi:hypothetical protein
MAFELFLLILFRLSLNQLVDLHNHDCLECVLSGFANLHVNLNFGNQSLQVGDNLHGLAPELLELVSLG